MIHYHPPLHVWTRHHPEAARIAQSLPRELLGLRTRLLVSDVCQRFGVATSTAMRAISLARRAN
ncbi:hypothetical protein ABB29_12085 [Pseudoxanthomonas dokdonensis]|uniref:Uncharacterized protein n=1 Tax=Pseudoxanthomonas dokdonensis TaxID=344882 RepID=A0A0R0CRS2_9GAMM|nr:hypothetical protein ABB29_12085 [Pseudoxanthomonas dokdonensis]